MYTSCPLPVGVILLVKLVNSRDLLDKVARLSISGQLANLQREPFWDAHMMVLVMLEASSYEGLSNCRHVTEDTM